ncbi:MAG: PA2169 family four-helix-bundle protein [Bacteroidota bacterium]
MSTITDKAVRVIKDLIIINNDRYEGYNTAATETNDLDLKTMFERFSNQSNQFNSELRSFIPREESPDGETTTSGKLYRVWMDVRAAITANDRKAVLSSCEFGEDVALASYKSALKEEELSEDIIDTISKHKNALQEAHNTVKAMRDSA